MAWLRGSRLRWVIAGAAVLVAVVVAAIVATMLFSLGSPDAVHQLQSDPALREAIGGVSAFQGLVDANLVAWLHQHKLLVLAWTVNDSQRFNELARLGVDGITTANLAILRALG